MLYPCISLLSSVKETYPVSGLHVDLLNGWPLSQLNGMFTSDSVIGVL